MNYQRTAQQVGKYGCLFLSCCYHANVIDAWPRMYALALSKGIIDPDCYHFDAPAFLGMVLGGEWMQIERPIDSLTEGDDYDILMFEKIDSFGAKVTHYVVGDGKGGVRFDPWENSLAVQYGTKAKRFSFRRK